MKYDAHVGGVRTSGVDLKKNLEYTPITRKKVVSTPYP